MKFTTYVAPAVAALAIAAPAPAHAELSKRELNIYWYGYSYGLLVDSCIHYNEGSISASTMEEHALISYEMEGLTPKTREGIRETFERTVMNEQPAFAQCLRIINRVWGHKERANNSTQTADFWY